jgi:flagellar M-ring protein FliF
VDAQAFLSKLRALGANFTTGQVVSLAASFVLVVAVVGGSAFWLNSPSYTLLFADMDQEAAAQVVTRLKSMKVPYVLDEGGRSIRVATDRVDELRLDLTAQGLPSSGRIGFEIFDRTSFGATEFVEQVNFRRALEGEIARTIGTLSEVSAARVHIAIGKDSLFGEKRPAKASVVLKLRDQRGLGAATAAGIANLVAASVEGLRPESVVILDSVGRPLWRPQDDSALAGSAQTERQQRMENDLATRVIGLLEPVVGEGRVRVNVALRLNPSSREQTEERWDPNTVVRSRQTSTDVSSAAGLNVNTIPVAGARGNLPPNNAAGPAPTSATTTTTTPAPPAGPGASRQTEVTNYEVSRTTTRTVEPAGDIARLSVAVIVDDAHETKQDPEGRAIVSRVPRSPQELQKLQTLVAAAVGVVEDRGDLITVENVSFEEPDAEAPIEPDFWTRYGTQVQDGGRTVAVLVIGLTALMLVRPLLRRGVARPTASAAVPSAGMLNAGDRPRTVAELESEIEAQMEAALGTSLGHSPRLPVLTRRVAGMAQKEPAHAAKLLRSWMADQES